MRFRIIPFIMLFMLASFAFSYEEVKNLSLSAAGIEKLEIDCGAGFLKVLGSEDLKEIEVKAEIILKGLSEKKAQEFIKKNVDLSLEKRGTRAVLVSKIDRSWSKFMFFLSIKEKAINLTVHVPPNMSLYVDDGSGSMSIENMAEKIEIEDGSGSIQVEKMKGNIEIKDGSGGIEVNNIQGNISIEDGSGGIEVKDIQGNISIEDGSGSIEIEDVQGEVVVNDGSGSINIDGVERDVIIKRDGSGSVNIRNVKGKIIK